jgi:hypothetical protein
LSYLLALNSAVIHIRNLSKLTSVCNRPGLQASNDPHQRGREPH